MSGSSSDHGTNGASRAGSALGAGLDLEQLGGQEPGGTTSPKMLIPLFLVPLLIVGVVIAIFLTIGSVVGSEKTVSEWIGEVESGGVNGRWQAAAHLTDLARRDAHVFEDPKLRARLRDLFRTAGPSDTRLRQWLATMWGLTRDGEAEPMMLEGLARTREVLDGPGGRSSAETEPASTELIQYVMALGLVGSSTSTHVVVGLAKDPDPGIRKVVAEALGQAGRKLITSGSKIETEVVTTLVSLHGDDDAWVRMNAALSLAKCGRVEGVPTLEAMLDRAWLKSQHLSFPDDGRYSVNNFDPAAEPIVAALIAIEWLHAPATGNAVAVADAALRDAVANAAKDGNQEVQQRAKALLAKIGG